MKHWLTLKLLPLLEAKTAAILDGSFVVTINDEAPVSDK